MASEMATNRDNQLQYDKMVEWLMHGNSSVERQLFRSAIRLLKQSCSGLVVAASKAVEIQPHRACAQPMIGRERSQVFAEQAHEAVASLGEHDIARLRDMHEPPYEVCGVLECVAHLLDGCTEYTLQFKSAQELMDEPQVFLQCCKKFTAWINEGKVPEQNIGAACAVKDIMGEFFLPDLVLQKSITCGRLCEWVLAVIAYFDAVENWEP
eukprot:gnl/MRDRNA2_/MRDRNA2_255668_c0_seq1.p1 gnl/MRDRNA2_/MRDRNA2_255668_c0~~gnl/MRDRNA2_/MRDRNA2_255668_c0_seq1.p1  ORF type:complete len:228 (-),score=46.36 gnl/MRDRNA2_/MRDRNA2_255668_c0_seq1:104-733(-)